jgi:hypothetical protein
VRALASIRTISEILPIDGADRIELAKVDGWQCVVKKGEFQPGDVGVYFEIDSKLPEAEWSEFLRPRGFKVKTVRLRGVLSQGLFLRIQDCDLGGKQWPSDGNVTDLLSVTKILSDSERREQNIQMNIRKPWPWYMKIPLVRKVYQWISPKPSGVFPSFIPKTDETRIQNLKNFSQLIKGRSLYATEKLDGQSVTVFYDLDQRISMFSKGLLGVCSRNCYFPNEVHNNWWNITKEYKLDTTLPAYCKEHNVSLAIQGEIVGPGIQDNIYHLSKHQLYIFNVYDIRKGQYLPYKEKLDVIRKLWLYYCPTVPLPESLSTQEEFLRYAEGQSLLFPTEREGLVIRDLKDDHFSFKAISNKFLLGD